MALQDRDIIIRGISRFPAELQERVHWLRTLVWERYPESTELVYIKANALAAGWALSDRSTDIFVSYAVYTKHINLGFNFGNEVADPKGLLQGDGKLYRFLRVGPPESFPLDEVLRLMDESWTLVYGKLKPVKQSTAGQTILKQDSLAGK